MHPQVSLVAGPRLRRDSSHRDSELLSELDAGGAGKTEFAGGIANPALVAEESIPDHPSFQLLTRLLERFRKVLFRGRIHTRR
jgi:hypothetical protein